MNKKNILVPLLPVSIMLASVFSHSCANTTTPPSGGPKDTIPPVVVMVSPLPGTTNVDRKKPHIVVTFDEYVTVKEPKNIFLSPPLDKAPKHRLKGKSLVVYLEETELDSAKTYILDITHAIADNNEGNMFPGYMLVFSTGDKIDSMLVSGNVVDCNTLKPVPGATVMLYKDQSDSAVFLRRPDAAAKTDEWGYFVLRNIQDTVYRMYAVMDENSNNKYDPESEKIAFLDSLVKPVKVVSDSMPELCKYDLKDTLHCLARPSEYTLAMFREKPGKQYIVNKVRVGERTAYITFMAPEAQIDSIWIKGVPNDRLITQFNRQKDSLEIWVNDPRKQPDTLYLNVDYMKTDTSGVLAKTHELVKLVRPKQASAAAKRSTANIKKEDTTCVIAVTATPERVEQYGFEIEFKYPVVKDAFESLILKWVNPKQVEGTGKYTLERDSLNLRKFTVRPVDKLMPGYEYTLKFPHRSFMDINGFYNDSLNVSVSLPKDDKLSTLSFDLTGVDEKYIIDLLDEKKESILRTHIVDSDCNIVFPYLKAGKYCIRITEDMNRNGMVETGNLLQHRQPEKVLFYTLADGTEFIEIMEKTEVVQNLDISEMFKDTKKENEENLTSPPVADTAAVSR